MIKPTLFDYKTRFVRKNALEYLVESHVSVNGAKTLNNDFYTVLNK